MDNPLLENDPLPAFSKIRPEHIEPALDTILENNKRSLEKWLARGGPYNWSNLLGPLEELDDNLTKMWSPVSHMNSVVNSDELREVYNRCLPKLTAYFTERGQDERLHAAYKDVLANEDDLDTARVKFIQDVLRDFRLSGIDLPEADKERFKEITTRLSELQSGFSDNVLDATRAWSKHFPDTDRLAGLPESTLQMAAQAAEREGKTGYLLTLDGPSYLPVMTLSDNRELRREFYEAYVTRASECGPVPCTFDNGQYMQEILKLRAELAALLGFVNYAEYSLATKMAGSTDQVYAFLNDLAARSLPAAQLEFRQVSEFARQMHGLETLEAWDLNYYAELFKQDRFDISQEKLRTYFPIGRVLGGMFDVVRRLYDIEFTEVYDWDTWHDDVRCFEIKRQGNPIAGFYLDLYARPGKRGGAWMDDCRVRRTMLDGTLQRPIAYLTCNFSMPLGDQDVLLTHNEVVTLFHEFGHGLHHMLSSQTCAGVSGINGVPWDAVELPSQFMENWCWQSEGLKLISGHVDTGEPFPDELLAKLLLARNFQSAIQMLRQLEFGLFDFELHSMRDCPDIDGIQEVLDQVRKRIAVVPVPEFNRFQHGFSHIFSGGYAAGYYSYKWAEVLSADAFSEFVNDGVYNRQTGERFLAAILEPGGSRDPMTGVVEFLGREPDTEALLRQEGIGV